MNRLRLDLLRRANGVLLQQFFANEVTESPNLSRGPLARRAPLPRVQRYTSQYPRLDDQVETVRHVTNPVAILNSSMRDNENEYIYKYLHKKLEERYVTVSESTSIRSPLYEQLQEILRLLKSKRDPDTLRSICESVRFKAKLANLDQLEMLLTVLRGHHHEEVWRIIKVVDFRLNWILKSAARGQISGLLDKWFYLADLLYEYHMKSLFNESLTSLLSHDLDPNVLSNQQLLHLLFLKILERQDNHLLLKYQRRLLDMISEASVEDLSIICLAYFKTRTLIKDKEMLNKIIAQTTKKLSVFDPKEPAYCAIVKAIRYSRDPENRSGVMKLINTLLEDEEHKILCSSQYNAVHTIKLMEAFRIYEPNLLHILRRLMFGNLHDFRIKDIQYALTSLSNLTYMDLRPDENLISDFDRLVDSIISLRRLDVSHQNYHLIPIIRSFSIFGYHSPKIISYTNLVLSDRAQVAKIDSVLEFHKSTLLIHAGNALEHRDTSLLCNKPLLDLCSSRIERYGNKGSIKNDISLDQLDFVLNSRRQQPNSVLFRTIALSLANHEKLRSDCYKFNFQYTFAHQNYSDLVVTRDIPEPGSFSPETLLPKHVTARSCLVFATQKTDFIDGHDRLCGYKQLLIRLMTRLGYSVLTVDLHQPNIDDLAQRIATILKN